LRRLSLNQGGVTAVASNPPADQIEKMDGFVAIQNLSTSFKSIFRFPVNECNFIYE
jgi:hypothetical protein